MEKLQKLNPEQIAALSPECLKIILGSDTKNEDIKKMKQFFDAIPYVYGKGLWFRGMRPDKNKLQKICNLFLKYHNDIFYLVPHKYENDIWGKDSNDIYKYTLYTEHEAKELLPTGCELNKISHRGLLPKNFESIAVISYIQEGELDRIENLVSYCKNIYFIHPILLQFADHFYS